MQLRRTKTPDRYDQVAFANGMNDSQFALNPIDTLNHDYTRPPIGRSRWRKFVKDGDPRGIKAKTVYPPMSASGPVIRSIAIGANTANVTPNSHVGPASAGWSDSPPRSSLKSSAVRVWSFCVSRCQSICQVVAGSDSTIHCFLALSNFTDKL